MPPRFRSLPTAVEHDVHLPGLDPRHDGVRIAHLSDIHVGWITPREHVRHAVELANQARADLIVMTGDYVCWTRKEIPLMEEQLSGLEAANVVVTLGNHDHFTSGRQVAESMRKNGYDVLQNQHRTIDIGGAPLQVIGVDDPVTHRHDLDRAFANLSTRGTRLVLCHCPEPAAGLAARGADLILSGHTHGGQIFIPGITDRMFERMGKRYRTGFYEVDGSQLYVTAGVGYSGVRMRAGHGTRAEIAVLTLRAAR